MKYADWFITGRLEDVEGEFTAILLVFYGIDNTLLQYTVQL